MIHAQSHWLVVTSALFAAAACGGGSEQTLLPFGGGGASGGASTKASGGIAGSSNTSLGGQGIHFAGSSNGGSSAGGSGGSVSSNAAGGRMVTQDCAATTVSAMDTTTIQPADIIFAIDSSKSMDQEIAFVRSNMNAFSQQIVASGVDARVIVIGASNAICIDAPLGSGSCPNDSKLPDYVHVTETVGSNDALNVLIDSFDTWRQYLRANASKSFVVVTDDDATDRPNNSAGSFTQNLRALDPALFAKFTFNGVYCFTECEQAAAIGEVYQDLVASTQGVGGDLCLQDFQPVFNRLAEKIITTSSSQIACEWGFPAVPPGQTFSGNLVDVRRSNASGSTLLQRVHTSAQCSTSGGWYFDNNLNPTKILACPSTCSEIQNQTGGRVDVAFGCEAVGSCVASSGSTLMSGGTSCEWTMPSAPTGQVLDPNNVNIRYISSAGFATDLGRVPSGAECAQYEDGWFYDNPSNPTKIRACPQTCMQIEAGGSNARVDVLFGCKTADAPIVK
ncbi:MAG: VWA domain-containing protein [Myxococcota bacterium]